MRKIAAARARRDFSKLLAAVRKGETVLITSRGAPAALFSPPHAALAEAEAAKAELLAHLKQQPVREIARWTRGDLYE
jgi:antitoxin (DNA-binding transcriptional repressor) of toxin-antitoxin stability system